MEEFFVWWWMVGLLNKEGLIQGITVETSDNRLVWFSSCQSDLNFQKVIYSCWKMPLVKMWLGSFSRLKPAEVCTGLQTPVSVEKALSAVEYSEVLAALELFCLNSKQGKQSWKNLWDFHPHPPPPRSGKLFFLPNIGFMKLSWWSLPESFPLLSLSLYHHSFSWHFVFFVFLLPSSLSVRQLTFAAYKCVPASLPESILSWTHLLGSFSTMELKGLFDLPCHPSPKMTCRAVLPLLLHFMLYKQVCPISKSPQCH